jgi:hypothetical protein
MNSIVRAWNRYQRRPKYTGPDSVAFDDEMILIEGEKKMPNAKIFVNEHSTAALALYGQQDRVEQLFVETRRTLKRLRIRNTGDAEPFDVPPEGQGSPPNLHDVVRWLDGLQKRNRDHQDDILFLVRLHRTARRRVRPEVLKQR